VLEEWIIHLTASGGINSQEETFSLILKNSLFQIFFVLQVCCLFQRLKKGGVLNGILRDIPLDVLLHLEAVAATVNLLAHHGVGLDASALDSIPKGCSLLALVIESLHAVLDLIQTFLFPVKSLDAGNVESVTNEVGLDRHVKRGVTSK
jgi:hypothetical protein